MALTPLDIHHKEFRTARFGGYNEEDVDSFLDLVADEFEKLTQQNAELVQRLEEMNRRLAEFEEMQSTLQNALLAATKSAEAIREQARKESESMINEAREEADSLLRSAREQSSQMIAQGRSEKEKLQRESARLSEIKKRYVISLKEIGEETLRQVEELKKREAVDFGQEATGPGEPGGGRPVAGPEPLVKNEVAPSEDEVEKRPPKTVVEEKAEAGPRSGTPVPPPPQMETGPREVEAEKEIPPDRAPGRQSGDDALREGPAETAGVQTAPAFEEPPVKSSELVDEILALDGEGDIYAGLEEPEGEPGGRWRRGKKGRKDKREADSFWE